MKADTKLNQTRTKRATSADGVGALSPARASHLADDLALEKKASKDQDLYDVGMIPFARTRLSVFAESDEEGIPDGFVETDIHAYLPLFGFVDGTVSRYDVHRAG